MNQEPNSPTIALESLGCKLNQAEIQALARRLEAAGFKVVLPEDGADIYILNTCTVTHVADHKARHFLRLARRRNPNARLIPIGCYAQRAPAELGNIEGVAAVLDNDHKDELFDYLLKQFGTPPAPATPAPRAAARTRAFLKIQDGCRNFCAYCIVPYVRRREYSVAADDILTRVAEYAAAGFREVVLTGTEIGNYQSGGTVLAALIKDILTKTSLTRLRLSSLQPHHITPALVSLWRDARLCPHFHLSLQSGSDAVLKRMFRRYTAAAYREAVNLIRADVPDAAITTDVIVGFPGETDREFRQTLDGCREMEFARIHVFPFSPRPGTAAAIMPGQVGEKTKKARAEAMLALSRESAAAFQSRFIGSTLDVLWERPSRGVWSGLTGNYIKVYAKSDAALTNLILPVKLVKPYRDGLWSET